MRDIRTLIRFKFFTFVLILLLCHSHIVNAQPPNEEKGCAENVGVNFPIGNFADSKMRVQPILRLNEKIDANKNDVRALLIIRDCKLVFERYKTGIDRDYNHTVYSVTKSITSTLVGSLMYQGKLTELDTPVSKLMPKPWGVRDANWESASTITLKNVMQMASGFKNIHNPGVVTELNMTNTDRLMFTLAQERDVAPNTKFKYSDADSVVTGAVVASLADENLYSYAKKALFDPLKMQNHDWLFRDRVGRYPGGWGLRLRPMDMGKIGQLYLQKGQWNGTRIFDESYLNKAWEGGVVPYYGLHWWIGDVQNSNNIPYFFANGFKGQRIYIFPTLRIVGVLSSSLSRDEEGSVSRAFITAIIKSIEPEEEIDEQRKTSLQNELLAIQKKPFNGETRVDQSPYQDYPSR